MAKVYLSEVIQNIKGSVKNHTFSCWKSRAILKQKAVSTSNPCSPAQASVRAAIAALSKAWYTVLTNTQRSLWEEYAQGLKSASEQVGPNANGGAGIYQVIPEDGGVMSGYNAFVKNNLDAISAGFQPYMPPNSDAPLGLPSPDAPTNLHLEQYCGIGLFTCSFILAWSSPVTYPVSSALRVWTLSVDAGIHKQIVLLTAAGATGGGFGTVKGAQGSVFSLPRVPGHYLIQMDCVSPNGQKSPPSNVITAEATPTCPACIP